MGAFEEETEQLQKWVEGWNDWQCLVVMHRLSQQLPPNHRHLFADFLTSQQHNQLTTTTTTNTPAQSGSPQKKEKEKEKEEEKEEEVTEPKQPKTPRDPNSPDDVSGVSGSGEDVARELLTMLFGLRADNTQCAQAYIKLFQEHLSPETLLAGASKPSVQVSPALRSARMVLEFATLHPAFADYQKETSALCSQLQTIEVKADVAAAHSIHREHRMGRSNSEGKLPWVAGEGNANSTSPWNSPQVYHQKGAGPSHRHSGDFSGMLDDVDGDSKGSYPDDGSGGADAGAGWGAAVPTWLKSLRLHKYQDLFAQMEYGKMLALTDDDLQQMGVAAMGARRKILLSIQKLKDVDKHLTVMEKDIGQSEKFLTTLEELRQLLSAPLQLTDQSQSPVPEQFVHILSKGFCHIMVSEPGEQKFAAFLAVVDKAIRHELFTVEHKKRFFYWRHECERFSRKWAASRGMMRNNRWSTPNAQFIPGAPPAGGPPPQAASQDPRFKPGAGPKTRPRPASLSAMPQTSSKTGLGLQPPTNGNMRVAGQSVPAMYGRQFKGHPYRDHPILMGREGEGEYEAELDINDILQTFRDASPHKGP